MSEFQNLYQGAPAQETATPPEDGWPEIMPIEIKTGEIIPKMESMKIPVAAPYPPIGTSRFLAFIPFVLKWECDYPNRKDGQYENVPGDNGGETKYGIDKASHPDVDIKNLTISEAVQIYFNEWTKYDCDALPAKEGEAYFDAAVNCGATRAHLFEKFSSSALVEIEQREAFYKHLARNNPHDEQFLEGWLNRSEDLEKYLGLV